VEIPFIGGNGMKELRILVVAVFVLLLGTGFVFAMQHEASVEKGKALFNDPKLGTTGKSCNDCHKNGEGMEKAGARKDLETVINACIAKSIKGKPLDDKSVEMQSLTMYIKSLGVESKAPSKKAPVGC
jgi:cytochrome c553